MNFIAYHFVPEGVACDEWRTTYIKTTENKSNLLTKGVLVAVKRDKFVSDLLKHIGLIFWQLLFTNRRGKNELMYAVAIVACGTPHICIIMYNNIYMF